MEGEGMEGEGGDGRGGVWAGVGKGVNGRGVASPGVDLLNCCQCRTIKRKHNNIWLTWFWA